MDYLVRYMRIGVIVSLFLISTLSSFAQCSHFPVVLITAGDINSMCTNAPNLVLGTELFSDATYQWELSQVPIPGATQSTYRPLIRGMYTVVVKRSCESTGIRSSAFPITYGKPGVITFSNSGCGPSTFAVRAYSGTIDGATAHKWYTSLNGTEVYQTSSLPSSEGFTQIQKLFTQTEKYYVAGTNSCGEGPRVEVVATINPIPSLTIKYTGDPEYVFPADNFTLTASLGFTNYQWYKNGVAITGATADFYRPTTSGTYKVSALSASCGIFNSTSLNITIYNEAQSNVNYVQTLIPQKPGIKSVTSVTSPYYNTLSRFGVKTVQKSTIYYDGAGRPVQQVVTQNSPAMRDVVEVTAYDEYGRESNKYLPYVDQGVGGFYKTDALEDPANVSTDHETRYRSGKQYQFYQNTSKVPSDEHPYALQFFEESPFDKVIKEMGSGKLWHDNNKGTEYTSSLNIHGMGIGQEKIIKWRINNVGIPERNGFHTDGTLTLDISKNENGREIRKYYDSQGQLILQKTQAAEDGNNNNLNDGSRWACTYYVYDYRGNLLFVLQPELVKKIIVSDIDNPEELDLDNMAFQFRYDERNRSVAKKAPGIDWLYLIYDKMDRVVLTQDGNQRASTTIQYWTFTKYDALDRPVLTGIKDTTAVLTQDQMQLVVDNYYSTHLVYSEKYSDDSGIHGYTNNTYPVVTGPGFISDPNRYLTVNYYDQYDFKASWGSVYNYVNEGLTETVNTVTYSEPQALLRAQGQLTGTKIKVLDGGIAGGYTWLKTVNYYNDRYSIIQSISDNYKGGNDRITNLTDFVGKTLKTKTYHAKADIHWINLVGSSIQGNKLSAVTTSSTWGASGAVSEEVLPANVDGWVEFTVSEQNRSRALGLSIQDIDAHYTSIDYAICMRNDGVLEIFEKGISKKQLANGYKTGDVLRLQRMGTSIKYLKNNVEIYVSSVSSSTALKVDAAFAETDGSLVNVNASFASSNNTLQERFVYDHAGRPTNVFLTTNTDQPVEIVRNEYNELGKLVKHKLHSEDGVTFKQSVDYSYNIRGFITQINDSDLTPQGDDPLDYFGMEVGYADELGTGNTNNNGAQYNGSISGIKWSVNQGLSDVKAMAYNFSYDPMGRILSATNLKSLQAGVWDSGNFNEKEFQYDLNGNIRQLIRYNESSTAMDNLSLVYGNNNTSNQLVNVIDQGNKFDGFLDGTNTADDYSYDANGNALTNLNQGITTTYNYLNLPETVTKGGNRVQYVYAVDGRKLSTIVTYGPVQRKTDYAGSYHYVNNKLLFINHEEGRVAVSAYETIYAHEAGSTNAMVGSNVTLSSVVQNEEQTYVQVSSNGNTTGSGIAAIGGPFPVSPGEQYLIRVKGYNGGTNPVHILANSGTINLAPFGASLPLSASSEAWIEQTVSIPAGVTQLNIGIAWNAVATGEQFFLNDIQLVRVSSSAPEFQYYLKDYLGNIRLTFTTKENIEQAVATLESTNTTEEESQFQEYNNVRRVKAKLFDHTNDTGQGYAMRLSGSANEKTGLARSFAVMPGDTIKLKVYAKYVDPVSENRTAVLNTFIAQLAAGALPANAVIDGAGYATNSTTASSYSNILEKETCDNTVPKAFLNYITFDKNANPIFDPTQTNYVQVTEAARENGSDVPHELLEAEIVAKQPGYVYAYLSNDDESPVDVYFDDFMVTQVHTDVIQSDDYYPLGLTFNSYQRENTLGNRYLFNGKERQDDLNTGAYDFEARIYDPSIGRFFSADKLSEKLFDYSPYNFTLNNAVNLIDADGNYPQWQMDPDLGKYMQAKESQMYNKMFGMQTSTSIAYDAMHDMFQDYKDNVYRWGGNQSVSEGGGTHVGSPGSFSRMFTDIVFHAIPVLPAVAYAIKDFRAGNYGSAALNAGLALTEFSVLRGMAGVHASASGNLGRMTNPAMLIKASTTGNDIALGLGDDLFNFAKAKGFQTYKDFSVGFQEDKILSAIQNSENRLHFNLTGFSKSRYSMFNPGEPVTYRNITNWELYTIYNTPGGLQRTTFYNFNYESQSYQIKPPPF